MEIWCRAHSDNYAQVMMGNIWAAEKMLGITINPKLIVSGSDSDVEEQAKNTAEEILAKYPNCNAVANQLQD